MKCPFPTIIPSGASSPLFNCVLLIKCNQNPSLTCPQLIKLPNGVCITVPFSYNVYLDIKDTLSAFKVNKLKEILNTKFGVFRNVQNIRSHESQLLQIADLMIGAISYNLNNEEKKVSAKQQIIEKIKSHSKQNLNDSSNYHDHKMNLFFIELR